VGARVEEFQMGAGEDGTDVVRAVRWKLCNAKDSCGSAPICEGWGGVNEWRGEGDDDGKGIRVVDDINGSVANIVDCGVGNKMAWEIRFAKAKTCFERDEQELGTRPIHLSI